MLRATTLCLVVCLIVPATGVRSASAEGPAASRPAAGQRPLLLPGTNPDVLTRIQGNALNSTGSPMADALVRLRDARLGRITDTAATDAGGLFEFGAVDPGSYIVEILGDDGAVLAASQLLHVSAGEVISTVVKLPFATAPFGGLLGHTVPAAAAVTTAAATSGVLAATVTGEAKSP